MSSIALFTARILPSFNAATFTLSSKTGRMIHFASHWKKNLELRQVDLSLYLAQGATYLDYCSYRNSFLAEASHD